MKTKRLYEVEVNAGWSFWSKELVSASNATEAIKRAVTLAKKDGAVRARAVAFRELGLVR
jgi:hypothetical protein